MADIVEIDPAENVAGQQVSEGWTARIFANHFAGKLLFHDDEGRWYLYDDAIWRRQRKSLGFDRAHQIAVKLAEKAINGKEMQSSKWAGGVARIAAASETFARGAEMWNQDHFICGQPKMTLDLSAGSAREPHPVDMISRSLACDASEEEGCPLWLEFLWQATAGDTELILFLQRWCGYCLTGDVREHTLVFIYGDGGNGKSVFVNTITGIVADYAVTAAMDTFTSSKGDKHSTDLAMLAGARLVTASETEEGRMWDEARIKAMTGGDPITARFMRQDFFTYRPQFKLTIIGNHQPILRNVDDALRRRFCMVPFTVKPEQPDTELEAKLRLEWPGILRWMINGCLDWQEHGLPRPESVRAATEEYFADQDLISQWLEDECEIDIGNNWKWETVSALFKSWSAYARNAANEPGSQKGFTQKLMRRGLSYKRTKTDRRFEFIKINRPTDVRFDDHSR